MSNAVFGAGLKIVVVAAGLELDVTSINITTGDYYLGNKFDIPTAMVSVNLGKVVNSSSKKASSQLTASQFKKLVEWGPAQIKCTVSKVDGLTIPFGLSVGEHVLFDGAVVSVALSQEAAFSGGGSVSCGLQIEHKVAGLFSGDLSTYPIYGAGAVSGSYTGGPKKDTIIKRVSAGITAGGSSKSVADFAKMLFNIRANPFDGDNLAGAGGESVFKFASGKSDVMSQLAAIDFQHIADKLPQESVFDFYMALGDTILNSVGYQTSYWDLLNTIVGIFDGWVVPNATGLVIRPYTPVMSRVEKSISNKEYTKIKMYRLGNMHPMDKYVGGGAAYGSNGLAANNYINGHVFSIVGLYSLPKALRRGDVMIRYEFNNALNIIATSANNPDTNKGAPESEMLKEYLTATDPNQSIGISNKEFVKTWLSSRVLQRALAPAGLQMITPLRFDLGIGNNIEIEMPKADNLASMGKFVGVVSGFDISVDAETKTPVSIYRIAGVLERSVYDSAITESKNAFATEVKSTGPWCT
jgi:hypothetical protein